MQSNSRNAGRTKVAPDRRSLACALVAVSGLGAAAWAQPAQQGNAANMTKQNAQQGNVQAAERMRIPAGSDTYLHLKVANPNAFASEAINTDGFPGVLEARAPRHIVYGELVFAAESRNAAVAAINGLRAPLPWINANMLVESPSLEGVYSINVRTVRNAVRAAGLIVGQPGIEDAFVNSERPRANLSSRGVGSVRGGGGDPALAAQWHIENTLDAAADHNIQAVHDEGITGAGVVVGILEAFRGNFTSPYDPESLAVPGYDFSDTVHLDLFPNFNQALSQITDPFQLDVSHETAVAGLVAATADNGIFGRGVAFGAGLAALRNGSTIETAEAWAHQLQGIDIINNSWGPVNVSYPQEGPVGWFPIDAENFEVTLPSVARVPMAGFEELSLERGLDLGRNKEGRVYVFAAGNSGHFQGWNRFRIGNAVSLPQFGFLDVTDSSAPPTGTPGDFDVTGADTEGWRYSGMMGDRSEYWEARGHPFTFSISAVGESNVLAGYSTTGTSIIAGGYSQGVTLPQSFGPNGYVGTADGRGITTTNPFGFGADAICPGPLQIDGLTCTFGGTSAASPIVAGIFALMLDANPNLSVRDIQHILQQTSVPINFDPAASYWTTLFGFGQVDPDDPNTDNPTFWQVNSGDVLHSDEFGFGVIDAEAAIAAASTWGTLPRLYALDSGFIPVTVEIPDAEFAEIGNIGTEEEPKIRFDLVPGERVSAARELDNGSVTGLACVRENYLVETVEITLTVAGAGAGDLFIVLESPRGSVSPIAVPRADSSGVSDGLAYSEYKFTTYKHWGELSGGTWNLYLQDYRPDDETPEGTLPMDDDPGEEHVVLLGPLGMPGGGYFEHTEKSLVSFKLVVYGTKTGLPPTLSCPAILTSCPGDLNGDGVVNTVDLQLFFEWYLNGDLAADVNNDGVLTFADILFFRSLWIPGFCDGGGGGLPGGRPVSPPGGNPNDPVVRPI